MNAIPEGWPRTVARTVWYLALSWAILTCWGAPPWDLTYSRL